MGGVWSILLYSLAALLAAGLAALILYVEVAIKASAIPTRQLTVSLRFFNGAAPPVQVIGDKTQTARRNEPSVLAVKKGRPSRRRAADLQRAILAAPKLVADILQTITVEEAIANVEFGLEDPADTGMLLGWLNAARYAAGSRSTARLDIRPVFDGAHLQGSLFATLRLRPIALLAPMVRFAWRVFGPVK